MFRVLFLEDNFVDANLIRRKISRAIPKIEILDAHDQQTFMFHLQTGRPDLILADYAVPEFSGLEAFNRSRELYPDIPFVFITGTIKDPGLAQETVLAQADGFVLKDHLDELITVLTTAVNSWPTNSGRELDVVDLDYDSYEQFRRTNKKIRNSTAQMLNDLNQLKRKMNKFLGN